MRATIFWRVYDSKNHCPGRALRADINAPEGTSWQGLVELGEIATGLKLSGKGSMGVFEIQTDEGIWSTESGRPLKPRTAVFKTWEQLDQEEP